MKTLIFTFVLVLILQCLGGCSGAQQYWVNPDPYGPINYVLFDFSNGKVVTSNGSSFKLRISNSIISIYGDSLVSIPFAKKIQERDSLKFLLHNGKIFHLLNSKSFKDLRSTALEGKIFRHIPYTGATVYYEFMDNGKMVSTEIANSEQDTLSSVNAWSLAKIGGVSIIKIHDIYRTSLFVRDHRMNQIDVVQKSLNGLVFFRLEESSGLLAKDGRISSLLGDWKVELSPSIVFQKIKSFKITQDTITINSSLNDERSAKYRIDAFRRIILTDFFGEFSELPFEVKNGKMTLVINGEQYILLKE